MSEEKIDITALLRELYDRNAICDALYNIASGVDRFDSEVLAENIWGDAVLDMGTGARIDGKDFIRALKAPTKPPMGRMHIVTNIRIKLEGSAAKTESFIVSSQGINSDDGNKTRVRAGRYLDRFEKRNNVWKLASRTLVDEWAREDLVKNSPGVGEYRSAPAPNDPVYALFYRDDE